MDRLGLLIENPSGSLTGHSWKKHMRIFQTRRIWTKPGGNSSNKPPGASYTAQGPQKQSEISKRMFRNYKQLKQKLIMLPYIHCKGF